MNGKWQYALHMENRTLHFLCLSLSPLVRSHGRSFASFLLVCLPSVLGEVRRQQGFRGGNPWGLGTSLISGLARSFVRSFAQREGRKRDKRGPLFSKILLSKRSTMCLCYPLSFLLSSVFLTCARLLPSPGVSWLVSGHFRFLSARSKELVYSV